MCRLKLFHVNVTICDNLISLIYRTKISPIEVISVYTDQITSPMVIGDAMFVAGRDGGRKVIETPVIEFYH